MVFIFISDSYWILLFSDASILRNIIERLMRFVRLGSLQKSVQRLFKFVCSIMIFHHTVSVYTRSVWYFTMTFSKIQHSPRICAECIDEYYRHLS